MKTLDGISFTKKAEYALCHISNLTDTIKALLREQLSFICYGKSASESGLDIYNYKNTLIEFLVRYENKSPDTQKGMIGELLSHIIINEYFDEYNVVSPFFNKEERSIKKGFDVVLSAKSDYSIWITEVKSGELHDGKDSNQTTYDLLGTAKRDLIKRLNEEENRSLWLNAINDAKLAFENNRDLKDAVVSILAGYGAKEGTTESVQGADINVFLVSALFAPLATPTTDAKLQTKSNEFQSENNFKKLFILSVQKGTYNKVYQFFKEESK